MPTTIEERSSALQRLATDAFGELTVAERELLLQTQRLIRLSLKRASVARNEGDSGMRRPPVEEDDEGRSHTIVRKPVFKDDIAKVAPPSEEERRIRSELFRWLCADRDAGACRNDFAIEIRDCWVQGHLDLSHLDIPFPVICGSCRFPDGINLDGASISHFDLEGSKLGPEQPSEKSTNVFSAEGLTARGSILLRGVHAKGEVNLIGADIRGDLSCSGGEFINLGQTALILDRAEIQGNLHLRRMFVAKGTVRLADHIHLLRNSHPSYSPKSQEIRRSRRGQAGPARHTHDMMTESVEFPGILVSSLDLRS